MNHDHLILALFGIPAALAFAALAVVGLCRSASRDRPHLPGALARDRAGFDADLRAQRDEGTGTLRRRHPVWRPSPQHPQRWGEGRR